MEFWRRQWEGLALSGRPDFDVVLKFRVLVLQSLHGLAQKASGTRSFGLDAFCGLEISDRVPDANTLWDRP